MDSINFTFSSFILKLQEDVYKSTFQVRTGSVHTQFTRINPQIHSNLHLLYSKTRLNPTRSILAYLIKPNQDFLVEPNLI